MSKYRQTKKHFLVEGFTRNQAACGSIGYWANGPLLYATDWTWVDCKRCLTRKHLMV